MGYDLHITRREWWADDRSGDAITFGDWIEYVAADPEIMQDPLNEPTAFLFVAHPKCPVPLWWRRGEVYTKNPDAAVVAKLVRIAKALGASVLGDDDEIYGVDAADPTKFERR